MASSCIGGEAMNMIDLASELEERALSITIWQSSPSSWTIWLFAQDDPALGIFKGEGDDLSLAIAQAFRAWDQVK